MKSKANSFYKHGRFADSIKLNETILESQMRFNLKNAEVSRLHSNNGMSFYFLKSYERCLECCGKAVEHDAENIKGD